MGWPGTPRLLGEGRGCREPSTGSSGTLRPTAGVLFQTHAREILMTQEHISRRNVLRGIAGGAVATGIAGKAYAGAPEHDTSPLDRTIVGLTADAPLGLARDVADEVYHELDFGDIGRSVAGQFSEEAITGLESNPHVRYVEQDQPAWALDSWGIPQVNADTTNDMGYRGNGATIAILDTGVQVDHPDLDVVCGETFGTTCSDCVEPYGDDNGHGTHVAGTAAARDPAIGVAPEAEICSVKVLDSDGGGSFGDIADGIVWAAEKGVEVINLSLGGGSGTSELRDACDYARNQGSFVVAAAGNDGTCCDCVGYPAAYDSVIAVSSTAPHDDFSSFSSTGPEIDIAAPGSDIYSTYINSGYDTLSGTSMASPHVAGAAAILMADLGYSNTQAESELLSSADDICLCEEDQGAGRLNVAAAVGLQDSEDCSGDDTCQNCDGGGGCYITTATAGESDTLDSLRRFRDESIAATPLGKALVGLYYRISPPIADTLAKNPGSLTTRATREIVEICAKLSDRQAETDSRVASMSLGTVLTMLYVLSIAVGAGGHAGISVRERIGGA